jgi:hypothetical protein
MQVAPPRSQICKEMKGPWSVAVSIEPRRRKKTNGERDLGVPDGDRLLHEVDALGGEGVERGEGSDASVVQAHHDERASEQMGQGMK